MLTPAFTAVTLSCFVYFAAAAATFPVLPRLVAGPLRGSNIDVGLVVGAFSVTAVLLRPLAGRMGDRRGRRPLMLLGASAAAASIAGYGLARGLGVLVLLRLVLGAGEALYFTAATTAITDLAPPERRGEAVSFFSVALYAGLAVGPLIGESVLDAAGFTPVWLLAGGLTALAALLVLRVPDTRPAGVAGAPARLVHPRGVIPGIVMASSAWGFAGFTAFVPLYALQLGMGGSRLLFALYSGIILSVRAAGARIPDRFGARRTAGTSLVASLVGLGVMAGWGAPAGLYVGAALFALGQSLAFPALLSLAVGSAPPWERGSVVGTFTAFLDVAFGVGPLTLGVVAESAGYRGAFAASTLVSGAGLALLLARVRPPAAREERASRPPGGRAPGRPPARGSGGSGPPPNVPGPRTPQGPP